jgi:hypothetical protein
VLEQVAHRFDAEGGGRFGNLLGQLELALEPRRARQRAQRRAGGRFERQLVVGGELGGDRKMVA